MIEPVTGGRCRRLSQLLYPKVAGADRPIPHAYPSQKNPLMRHWFDDDPSQAPENIVHRNISGEVITVGQDSSGELFDLY